MGAILGDGVTATRKALNLVIQVRILVSQLFIYEKLKTVRIRLGD